MKVGSELLPREEIVEIIVLEGISTHYIILGNCHFCLLDQFLLTQRWFAKLHADLVLPGNELIHGQHFSLERELINLDSAL